MAIIYIPNHLYPTPSASGKNTRYTSCTPSYNKRQTFTSIHSIAKTLKKASQNFSVFQPPTEFFRVSTTILCTYIILRNYSFYATALSISNLITNSSCKKSQNHFVRLVSSSPFRPFLSKKFGRNSIEKH